MSCEPVLVELPLRGEWVAYHTPAERIPSHGTDQLGQRFAYDFMQIERGNPGWKFFRSPQWRYLLFGVPLADCPAWGQPIYAPFAGSVVAARDGWPERRRVHPLRDLAVVLKNALLGDPQRPAWLHSVLGNHVILKKRHAEVYALFAHARTGSVQVRTDDDVAAGDLLAQVGHSGNSTAPHLHFHLMDRHDILSAAGIPCAFRRYEALRDGVWVGVAADLPAKREFIRHDA